MSGGGAKPPPKGVIKPWQFWFIKNNFFALTLSLPNLAWKYENIRPIKMAHRMIPNFKLWRHICWRHSYVILNFWISQFFIQVLKQLFKGSWKLKKFSNSQIWAEMWHFEFVDKFKAQKRDTLPPSPCKISLNLRVSLSSRPCYLSYT